MIYNYKYIRPFKGYKDMLDSLLDDNGDKTAFLYSSDPTNQNIISKKSYKSFYNDIASLCKKIRTDNITGNVAVIGPNSYCWCISYFALSLSNLSPVLIDKDLPASCIASQIIQCDVHHVFIDTSYNPKKSDELQTLLPSLLFYDLEKTDCLISKLPETFIPEQKNNETSISIFYTSGTSNKEKPVMVSQQGLCNAAWRGHNSYKMNVGEKSLLVLPLNHIFGFVAGLLWTLSAGGTVCIGLGLKSFTYDFKLFNPHICCLVPSLISLIGKLISKDNEFCGTNLKVIISGGAAGNFSINKFLSLNKINVLEGYGLTETCSGVAMEKHPLTGLSPCINVSFSIDDLTSEILVKSDSQMLGYYNDSTSTNAAFTKDGYIHTGDIGEIKNGFLYIYGRLNDIIVLSNGQKINPSQIENKLMKIEGIKDAVIIYRNNIIGCIIYPSLDDFFDIGNFEKYISKEIDKLNTQLPYYMQIASIKISESPLKRNAKGDIKKYLLDYKGDV